MKLDDAVKWLKILRSRSAHGGRTDVAIGTVLAKLTRLRSDLPVTANGVAVRPMMDALFGIVRGKVEKMT